MSNERVVRLTCVSRVTETVCSVFISVRVIHCNVCAYVALHFQWLPCLNILRNLFVIPVIVKTYQCHSKCNIYCILPCGVEH